nr:hypothetical protein [uncultured bacterium]
MIRVFLIDDHVLFREGLKQIFAKYSDINVLAEAGTSQEAMEKLQLQQYDVVLLDVTLPGRSGPELLRDIKKIYPQLAILILSMHPEDQYAVRMIKSGASGYITKESAPEELIAAIRKVARGGRYISAKLAEEMAVAMDDNSSKLPHQLLSNREYQVMRLIASGKSLKEIADELMVSEKTVTTYRARILEKMKLKNNVELTIYAISHRLLPWYFAVRNQNQSQQE